MGTVQRLTNRPKVTANYGYTRLHNSAVATRHIFDAANTRSVMRMTQAREITGTFHANGSYRQRTNCPNED